VRLREIQRDLYTFYTRVYCEFIVIVENIGSAEGTFSTVVKYFILMFIKSVCLKQRSHKVSEIPQFSPKNPKITSFSFM
jgi:hypothetical protein